MYRDYIPIYTHCSRDRNSVAFTNCFCFVCLVLGFFFVVVLVGGGGGGSPPDTVISTGVIQHPSSLPKCRQSLKPYNKVKTQQHPKCFTIYETGNAP